MVFCWVPSWVFSAARQLYWLNPCKWLSDTSLQLALENYERSWQQAHLQVSELLIGSWRCCMVTRNVTLGNRKACKAVAHAKATLKRWQTTHENSFSRRQSDLKMTSAGNKGKAKGRWLMAVDQLRAGRMDFRLMFITKEEYNLAEISCICFHGRSIKTARRMPKLTENKVLLHPGSYQTNVEL